MMWIVYILVCGDGSFYTGITKDMERRLTLHTSGKGAKYTRGRGPFAVLYTELHDSKSSATTREMQIKALNRRQKLQLAKA